MIVLQPFLIIDYFVKTKKPLHKEKLFVSAEGFEPSTVPIKNRDALLSSIDKFINSDFTFPFFDF